MRLALVLFVLLTTSALGFGQTERYELGHRLRAFEATWETTDVAGRDRGLTAIRPVTKQFLTFQLTAAARTLDAARVALTSADPPSDARLAVDSLGVAPAAWLVDAADTTVNVTISPVYPTKPDVLRTVVVRAGDTDTTPRKFPTTVPVPLDGKPTVRLAVGDTVAVRGVSVARAERLKSRLTALREATVTVPASPTIEQATAADRADLLTRTAAGDVPETVLPFARLLTEAEAMSAAEAEPFFTPARPGEHWLTVPTAGGKRTPCRTRVPPKLDATAPVPVVIALHGMGGSENLFFDGYGAGCVPAAAAKRGWVVVSPRGGLGFLGGPPPVPEIVAALATRYPIDRTRVFLIGHSMGSAQAVELGQKHPGAFAAVACLGGGGKVQKPAAFAGVPVFVGVGTEDFARPGAEALFAAISGTDGAGDGARWKEYTGVEHTVIVRAAVDDVFAEWDRVSRKLPAAPRKGAAGE
ncbi:MAG: hypothetical protein ACRC7O_11045 [Fimbriiglobus sp.]